MTKINGRIMRGSEDVLTSRLRIIAFASDDQTGGVLEEQLRALGVTSNLVVDVPTAVTLISSEPDYDAIVVDAAVSSPTMEELLAQVTVSRRGKAPIAIFHIQDNVKLALNPLNDPSLRPLTQPVASQDLGAALDELSRSVALTNADVQRQVEIIARAAIRLGQRLNSINHRTSTLPVFHEVDNSALDEEPLLDVANSIAVLRRIIRERRLRQRFFEEVRFGEPAWDIMLDLTLAWFEGKAVAVSSLCIASGVPVSTAMRWINDMVEAGIINRWIDPTDARRNLMQISPATRDAMLRYLAAIDVSENAANRSEPPVKVPPFNIALDYRRDALD